MPSSPEFLTIQTFKMEESGVKPRMELIDLCFLCNDRLVQTAEQAFMDSSGTSLGFQRILVCFVTCLQLVVQTGLICLCCGF